MLVDSQINRQDGPPIRVEWKLHDKDGKPLLTDVIVEGVSMAFTQRQQFESVIQNNGGKVDALLAAMKKQISKRCAPGTAKYHSRQSRPRFRGRLFSWPLGRRRLRRWSERQTGSAPA